MPKEKAEKEPEQNVPQAEKADDGFEIDDGEEIRVPDKEEDDGFEIDTGSSREEEDDGFEIVGMTEKDVPYMAPAVEEEPKKDAPVPEAEKDDTWLKERDAQIRAREDEEKRRIDELYAHAEDKSGYSAYERKSVTSKQALRDLCQEYELYLGADPEMKRFIGQVRDYTEQNGYLAEGYEKELAFIGRLPRTLEHLEKSFREQEEKLQADIRKVFPDGTDGVPGLTAEELRRKDAEFTFRQEVIDNKRRIAASIGVYFDTLAQGELHAPMEDNLGDAQNKAVQDADLGGYKLISLKDVNGNSFKYMNAAGQKLGTGLDPEVLPDAANNAVIRGILNATTRDKKKPDVPLFPHEPGMNDVKQGMAGICYLYAALQDTARLYPEKIKNMVKDNGDGTATVRLFEKTTKNGKTTFSPLFVRVDKGTPTFMGMQRGGQDCMWVNVIERAYAMSGMHLTRSDDNVRAADPEELQLRYREFKDHPENITNEKRSEYPWLFDGNGSLRKWAPGVDTIEGGDESKVMEVLMGPDFLRNEIEMPTEEDFKKAAIVKSPEKLTEERQFREELDATDLNDVEQAFRFGMRKLFAPKNFADYLHKPREEMIRESYAGSDFASLMSEQEYVDTMSDLYQTAYRDFGTRYVSLNRRSTPAMTDALASSFDRKIFPLTESYQVLRMAVLQELKGHMRDTIPQPKEITPDGFFDEVAEKLRQGQPVSASTPEKTDMVAGQHAYSIIGAYKTQEEPPRAFFRIRNPWGDRTIAGSGIDTALGLNANGIKYREGENRGPAAKWVHREEGIFDIEVRDYCRVFDGTNYNGSQNLIDTPHRTEQGYEILPGQDVHTAKEHTVTDPVYREYARCANDIYASLLATNSRLSHDSPEYKALAEQVRVFRENVSLCRGESTQELKNVMKPLRDAALAYMDHVPGKASSRQRSRLAVCSTILMLDEAIQTESPTPAAAMEEKLAENMLKLHFAKEKKPEPENLAELAHALTSNRAFRTVAEKANISDMLNSRESVIKNGLSELEKLARGKGEDKGLDLDTLKTQEYSVKV